MIDIDQTLTDELKKLFEQTRKEMLAEEQKVIDVRICVFMFQIASPTISDGRLGTIDEAEIEQVIDVD